MNGLHHRALGGAAFLAAIPFLPVHSAEGLATAGLVAVATSSGRLLSPDADQGWLWHLVDRLIPDERLLGDNGPMQHRGITHFWPWPVLAWLLASGLGGVTLTVTFTVDGHPHGQVIPLAAVFAGLAVGHGSHIFGDFLVGARGQGRGPGVPLLGWRAYVGLGFKCGGAAETVMVAACLAAAGWFLAGSP